jgi:hypothetical protein
MSDSGKLIALRAAKAQRAAEAAELLEKLEIQTLELEAELAEKHGTRGVTWDIVETSEGPIGLVMGDAVLFKKLQESEVTHDDAFAFVVAQVVAPEATIVKELLVRRRGIVDHCLIVLTNLHRGNLTVLRGKS